MRLDLAELPEGMEPPPEPGPGTLYRTTHGTFHMLIAVTGGPGYGERAHVIKFDRDGNPTGVQTYGATYLSKLARVGQCPELLNVEWQP
jgi:hypothetical protein